MVIAVQFLGVDPDEERDVVLFLRGSSVGPVPPSTFDVTPAVYAEMIRGTWSGICGRVVRGRNDKDFENLSFAEGRRLAWVVGPQGMRRLVGKSGTEIVLGIGKDEDWLRR